MKGLRNVTVAQKKPDAQMPKKRKAEQEATKKKASKKDSGAPKRPLSAYLLFMEDFRKTYKENFPDNKSVAVVAKAGGEKWKSMPVSEKAPYAEKASKKKAEYEKALAAHKQNMNSKVVGDAEPAQSSKSSSEVHNDGEEEASS
ncbi:HMG1/2-like protein [Punica granatum]|uniref:HMG1/2-like protein n=1 Tax=Punica granatum TaxID=22663 RepID=A0A6P8DCR5_PUNGR|nr:HMG1/2-like protein [Punica granatum]